MLKKGLSHCTTLYCIWLQYCKANMLTKLFTFGRYNNLPGFTFSSWCVNMITFTMFTTATQHKVQLRTMGVSIDLVIYIAQMYLMINKK